MLADAKLPVTFWAEAVNTACYVQNRVLVNKSQNKTPYELFNGRTPAIGFLKPFGYNVMILNTLDNLGKFEAKGNEGYFIGYSMSSKAFRVFNKRTRRVEENLHVEFLKNKAIDQSAGPNWLFDIYSLIKSMNYVPVDAGTNSTNFLGTNDAANQEVKKDVSSLRYILLPNWAYDALLETSSSKPHDESITKIPEGSGKSNPTTSLFNPSADQIEKLTVESPIPTVSSPVPTACLNDSPEPSSEARLILKRVANQEESPSLDNILSLTNRFEDIFRVTTSSNEAIGVEADVSNMGPTISASPTPTLRIHKDHPKSQIIGPMDTPIQTRHKSKELGSGRLIMAVCGRDQDISRGWHDEDVASLGGGGCHAPPYFTRDDDKDDDEAGGDDEHESDEETQEEERFDRILQTPKDSEDESDGGEDLGLNIGIESFFETTSQIDVQTPTSVAPLPITTPTMTSSTIATTTQTSQAPTLPTIILSEVIQHLPSFGSLFRFDDRLRSLEQNFFEVMQTN
nr:ribonuclease H-like domain-containing protein [Tanacetum cinerariifolium]